MSRFSGHHHTEESKEKMRQASMGNKYSLGCHATRETRLKMSMSQKGRTHTEETKGKIRQSKIGKPRSEETKAKLRLANLGNKLTEEHKAKLLQAIKGKKLTEEHKAKLRGKKSIETRARMSKGQLGNKNCLGIRHSDEIKAKMSQAKRIQWQNPEYKERVIRASMLGRFIHPNKPETLLFGLLESVYPSEWKFVGDGELIIAGRNPDFANVNGRKELIELFGDYWHRGENPQERIDLFKRYGFNTLVIWENELKDPSRVLDKVAKFRNENIIEDGGMK